jgi:hypothetical protein
MGDLEIINIKTGSRLIMQRDGSELRDDVPTPSIEWCDRGQHYASKLGGQDVADTLWICATCQ